MKLSGFAGILWVAGFLLNCGLFAILCIRRRLSQLPIFCLFIGFSAVRSVVLFWLWDRSQWHLYQTMYFGCMFSDTFLQLCLIWEIASKVFRRRGVWRPDIRARLAAWSVASVAAASALTALQQTAGRNWLQNAVLHADFFPSVMISELFIVMLVLSSEAGLNWRTHVASITVGLAAFNFPAVVIDTIANLHGFDNQGYLSRALENARKELYLACLLYWCYSLWRAEPKPRAMSPYMEGQVSALKDVLVHQKTNWGKK